MPQVHLLEEGSLHPQIKVGQDDDEPMCYEKVGKISVINGIYVYEFTKDRWPYSIDLVLCTEGLFHCLSYDHKDYNTSRIAHWPSRSPASTQEWVNDGMSALNVLEHARQGRYFRVVRSQELSLGE
jgi:hypothetical protein